MIRRVLPLIIGIAMAGGLAPPPAMAQAMPTTGLDFSSWYTVPSAAAKNATDDVQALLVKGSSVDEVDSVGRTGLIYAAMLGNEAMAQILIDHGAKVGFRDNLGNTPLHWAAQRGSVELVTLFLGNKAVVDATNKQGITPLMLAASAGQAGTVRLLLKSGADPAKQDFTGRDALGWAQGKGAVLQVLRDAKRG